VVGTGTVALTVAAAGPVGSKEAVTWSAPDLAT
jgi:hypothetical protein